MKRKFFQPVWKYLFHLGKVGMNYWPASAVLKSGEVFAMKYANDKLEGLETKIIFDGGANLGQFAMVAEKLFANPKKIYCFEPSQKTIALLNTNLARNPSENFEVINMGLSDSVRMDNLYSTGVSASIASLHIIPEQFRIYQNEFTECVQLITLDDFCIKKDIKRIDYLKLDLEGHEFFALKGAHELLKNKKINFIQFEFGKGSLAARIFFRDIFDLLSANYHLYRLATDGLIPLQSYSTDLEIFDAANYLAELI